MNKSIRYKYILFNRQINKSTIQNSTNWNKTADVILKEITNNNSATLTWISLSWITTKEQVATKTTLLLNLWFNISTIEKIVINWGTVVGQSGSVIQIPQYPWCSTAWTIFVATSKYTWCNTNDIILCSWAWIWYTIAACNVWSTTAGTTSISYGNFFQFGKKDTSWVNWYSWYSYDWKASGWVNWWSANDWWIEDAEKETAIYSNQNTTDQDKMRWPCDTWYHVPSILEWSWILTSWWWWTNAISMSNAIKLPLVGYRDFTNYTWANSGGYRSSSPNDVSGYALRFSTSIIYPKGSDYRGNWFAIRCIKN